MAIQLVGFLFAASRGGTLAFSCSLALWWLLGASLEKKVMMAVCIGGLAAVVLLIPDRDALLASNPLTARLTTTTVDLGDSEAAQRVGQWKQAWNEFLLSPIFGTGRANYGQLSRYNVGDYAHNTYLGVLAAVGMLGAATYGGFVLFFAWTLIKEHPFVSAGARWPTSALLFAALAEIGLAGMTISIENNRIVWVYLAVLACYRRLYLAGPAKELSPRRRATYAPPLTAPHAAIR
jgi:O-antigen ligase